MWRQAIHAHPQAHVDDTFQSGCPAFKMHYIVFLELIKSFTKESNKNDKNELNTRHNMFWQL